MRRLADWFATGCFIFIVTVAAAFFGRIGERVHAGPFVVIDGDSLRSGETEFRLEGIDAPEYRQTCGEEGRGWQCGREAARQLRELLRGGNVSCRGLGVDRYGRTLARCASGNHDINGEMVRLGYAVAYGDYHAEEREARTRGVGLWAGAFTSPREWRRKHGDSSGLDSAHGVFHGLGAQLRQWLTSIQMKMTGE